MQPLAQGLLRFTGMVIEFPSSWEEPSKEDEGDDAISFTNSALDKESVVEEDHSTGCSTSCFGVRFHEAKNVYHELSKEYLSFLVEPHELWYSPEEINQLEQQAKDTMAQQSLCTTKLPRTTSTLSSSSRGTMDDNEAGMTRIYICQNALKRAYHAASKAKTETNTSPMTALEKSNLLAAYLSMPEATVGLERQPFMIDEYVTDAELRRLSILRVVQQLSKRYYNNNNNNRYSLLQQANAIRLASQSISRPARMFAQEVGQTLALAVLQSDPEA